MDINTVVTFRIIIRYFLMGLMGLSVTFIFWYFASAFTKNKIKRLVIVGILILASIGLYKVTHSSHKVVRMKEDVLYIKPKSSDKIK